MQVLLSTTLRPVMSLKASLQQINLSFGSAQSQLEFRTAGRLPRLDRQQEGPPTTPLSQTSCYRESVRERAREKCFSNTLPDYSL